MIWKSTYLSNEGIAQLITSGELNLNQFGCACREVLADAQLRNGNRLLVDSRDLKTPQAPFELLEVPGILRQLEHGKINQVAVVHGLCPEIPGIFSFFEDLLSSGGCVIRFFADMREAFAWLTNPAPLPATT